MSPLVVNKEEDIKDLYVLSSDKLEMFLAISVVNGIIVKVSLNVESIVKTVSWVRFEIVFVVSISVVDNDAVIVSVDVELTVEVVFSVTKNYVFFN